jgi:hypothetical protein
MRGRTVGASKDAAQVLTELSGARSVLRVFVQRAPKDPEKRLGYPRGTQGLA